MKRIIALLAATLLSVTMAQTGTLKVLYSSQITTLEPQDTTDTDSAGVRYQIFNGLVRMSEAGKVEPDLATSWDISPDGTVYTFHLRQGVKFQDGTDFNAQAVVTSFDRLLDPKRNTSASAYFQPVVAGVKALDDYTVQFTLKQAFQPFLNTMAHPAGQVMSPASIKQYGDKVGEHPVGTGPYELVDWVRGDHLTLKAFNGYFGGTPALKGITYQIIPEASTRIAMLESGQADVILRVTPDDAKRLAKDKNVRLKKTSTDRAMFFAINTTRKPFNDVRVRQAINYAVNVRQIVDALFGSDTPVLDSPLAPSVTGYVPIFKYGYDPKKATQLLQEAGYKPSDITIHLWSPQGRYVQDSTVSQAVAQQLQAFGFKVDLQIFGDFSKYIKVAFGADRGDMMFLGWAPSTIEAWGGMYQVLDGERANQFANNSGFDNPVFDSLLLKARSQPTQAASTQIYGQAEAIVMAEAPWVPMYPQPVLTGIASNVSGIQLLPSGQLVLRSAKKQ